MNEITIVQAEPSEYEVVGKLVNHLLVELFPEDEAYRKEERYISAAKTILENEEKVWALLAKTAIGEVMGVLTLNECTAIYAGGHFGEISELYVEKSHRSSGVGAKLIDAAKQFGLTRGWPEIEVGAPPQPEWKKSVDFYMRQGFKISGPRMVINLEDSLIE